MGEYAKYHGQEIKIGTCEDMLYLRYDQKPLVRSVRNSINLDDAETVSQIRFRFPFPQEDGIEPGAFDNPDYSLAVPGMSAGPEVEHYSIQFSSPRGYLVSLPCPESEASRKLDLHIHRNGFAGAVHISQQRFIDGQLMLVLKCGGCGAKWRVDRDGAQAVIDAFNREADAMEAREDGRPPDGRKGYWREIARRIEAGYDNASVLELVTA